MEYMPTRHELSLRFHRKIFNAHRTARNLHFPILPHLTVLFGDSHDRQLSFGLFTCRSAAGLCLLLASSEQLVENAIGSEVGVEVEHELLGVEVELLHGREFFSVKHLGEVEVSEEAESGDRG